MKSAAQSGFLERSIAALPLAVPTSAGLAYLALFDAPVSYLYVNTGALFIGAFWAAFGRLPSSVRATRTLLFALVALLALPLIAGPEVEGIARWISLAGFTLHVGMLVAPLIAVLSAQEERYAHVALLAAMLLTLFQPDPASAFAILAAGVSIAVVRGHPNWAGYIFLALTALGAIAFLANLPPQDFVERILPDLFLESPLSASLLSFSLIAGLALTLRAPHAEPATRFALAGVLAGFILAALVGDYPTPLIGYGAASIIGLGLALPALRARVCSNETSGLES